MTAKFYAWVTSYIYIPKAFSQPPKNMIVILYCNTAARGLTDIYAQSRGHTAPKGEFGYISKTPSTSVLQHLCNTFNSRVLHCLQLARHNNVASKYYAVIRRYHIDITFQKLNEEMMRWFKTQTKLLCCSDRPAFAHVKRLESMLISCLYQGLIKHLFSLNMSEQC